MPARAHVAIEHVALELFDALPQLHELEGISRGPMLRDALQPPGGIALPLGLDMFPPDAILQILQLGFDHLETLVVGRHEDAHPAVRWDESLLQLFFFGLLSVRFSYVMLLVWLLYITIDHKLTPFGECTC